MFAMIAYEVMAVRSAELSTACSLGNERPGDLRPLVRSSVQVMRRGDITALVDVRRW